MQTLEISLSRCWVEKSTTVMLIKRDAGMVVDVEVTFDGSYHNPEHTELAIAHANRLRKEYPFATFSTNIPHLI